MEIPNDSNVLQYLVVLGAAAVLIGPFLFWQWLLHRPRQGPLEQLVLDLIKHDHLLYPCFARARWRHWPFGPLCLKGTVHPEWPFTPRFEIRRSTGGVELGLIIVVNGSKHLYALLLLGPDGAIRSCAWLDGSGAWTELHACELFLSSLAPGADCLKVFAQQVHALEERLVPLGMKRRA